MLMDFERLVLTKKEEFFRFSMNFEVIAYLLLEDTFSKTDKKFGELFFEDDFIPEENHILVKIGTMKTLENNEREFLLSFADGLLRFKPSVDYVVDFFDIKEEIFFDYPKDKGFFELIQKINSNFNSNISIANVQSFNDLIQY